MTTETQASELATGLRQLADMIEADPLLAPVLAYAFKNISEPANSRDELVALARAGARSAGKVAKDFSSKHASVQVVFGPVMVEAWINREAVCDAVVVGTETVIEKGPDPEAVAALPIVEREVTRDVIEWRCRPLLADESEAETAGAAS